MKIALIANLDKPKAISCALNIAKLFQEHNVQVLMHRSAKELIGDAQVTLCENDTELFELCDCAVTVGGDGTIIHSARHAAVAGKSVIGVNMGRLGYVAEVEPAEISMLARLVTGEYTTNQRMLLDVTVIRKDGSTESYIAVNDAVISRGSLSRIIDLCVSVDGEKITDYRADGLLFSTPTGSTAYALSAGGPVIDPGINLIELTPVCPHSLTARTVIFSDNKVITVTCNSSDTVYLTVDGQISVTLEPSDTVRVSRSEYNLLMNSIKEKNFYKNAGEKLKEGD